jgi:hypothetical protein
MQFREFSDDDKHLFDRSLSGHQCITAQVVNAIQEQHQVDFLSPALLGALVVRENLLFPPLQELAHS